MAGPTRQRLDSGTSCRHREGPKWSRGESKEREPSGVWRWKAASVWCLGSGEWEGFTGKEAEKKGKNLVKNTEVVGKDWQLIITTVFTRKNETRREIKIKWRQGAGELYCH